MHKLTTVQDDVVNYIAQWIRPTNSIGVATFYKGDAMVQITVSLVNSGIFPTALWLLLAVVYG